MRMKFCSLCGRMAMWNFVFCPWCGQEFPLALDGEKEGQESIARAVHRCEAVRDGGMEERIRGLADSLEAMDRDLEEFIVSGIECRLSGRGQGGGP